MPYIIVDPCVGVKDESCVAVCPVDCIIATEEDTMMFIHPDECIECGACLPECPVNAIFSEEEVPEDQKGWVELNADYFKMDRNAFLAKHGDAIDAAKAKNKGSALANPALYA
ncbi:MAG: ferredoxin family protein [Dehalococcoidia bacterium]|nr:ferredoxin family protein [Dehalococcoidia bacterium]